jgi:hypothetical protein
VKDWVLEHRYALHFAHTRDDPQPRRYVLGGRSAGTLKRLLTDPSVGGVTNVDPEGRILREPIWSLLRRWLHVPVVESPMFTRQNAAVWLYDALFFTPFAAAALLVIHVARRRTEDGELAKVVATIVLSLLFNIFLIRGNLDSRLADVVVPAALLWSWMLRGPFVGLTNPSIATISRAAAATAVMLTIWMSVDLYAGAMNQLTASDLFSTPLNAARRLKGAVVELRREPLDQFAPAGSTGLRALARMIEAG